MGLFTRSFDKPGKGVDPNEPQKRSFFRFFDIFFRKFWHFVKVNLIYAVVLIPTFLLVWFISAFAIAGNVWEFVRPTVESISEDPETANYFGTFILIAVPTILAYLFAILWGMGPATAGVTYVLRNFAREEHAWIWSDFKDALKSNFKQSLAVFGIDLVLFMLFYFAILFYSQMPGVLGALRYVIFLVVVIYTMMHFYLYPLMVTFKLSLKDLYRNSLLFALGKLPSNLLVLVILLGVHLGSVYVAIAFGGAYAMLILLVLLVLEVLILLSFSAFLVNFNTYPKMKKYMLVNVTEEVKPDVAVENKLEDQSEEEQEAVDAEQNEQSENQGEGGSEEEKPWLPPEFRREDE